MNRLDSRVPNFFAISIASLMATLGGTSGWPEQLVDRRAQDVPVHQPTCASTPSAPPSCAMSPSILEPWFCLVPADQILGKGPGLRVAGMPRPELGRPGTTGIVAAPHVELIEELEGRLARLSTSTHAHPLDGGPRTGPPRPPCARHAPAGPGRSSILVGVGPRTGLPPRAGSPGILGGEVLDEVRHLEGRGRGFLAPVADRAAGARPGLFLRRIVVMTPNVAGGNPRGQRHVTDAGGSRPGHVLEVRSLAANHHPHAHDGGVSASLGEAQRGLGQFERAGDPVQLHRLRGHLCLCEGVARPFHQPGHDGLVEAGRDDPQIATRRPVSRKPTRPRSRARHDGRLSREAT